MCPDDAAFETHRNRTSMARWRKESAGMISKETLA
jgi:quinol monooxygenase YgiN